jgi:hypothetical protein
MHSHDPSAGMVAGCQTFDFTEVPRRRDLANRLIRLDGSIAAAAAARESAQTEVRSPALALGVIGVSITFCYTTKVMVATGMFSCFVGVGLLRPIATGWEILPD